MGNIETKSELPDRKNFHILDYGYCRVWKRKLDDKQIMEQYPIYIESQERLKMFQNVWPLRTNHLLFVNVYHFAHSQPGNLCSGTTKGSLFTERIPYRLSEFGNIKYPQIVKIMKSCIQGYTILYENFGVFVIRSTMIGFTQDFQVKVWCHTDFSEPQPQNPNCKGLQQMLISLINAVQTTCEHLYYNCPKFSQFIVQTNYIYLTKNFDFLLKGLNDYVNKLGIKIPEEMTHLISFFKKPQGWEKFKAKNNYPKLLTSQIQISSDATTVQSNQKQQIDNINTPKQQIKLPSPSLQKSSSISHFPKRTIDRVNLTKLQSQPYLIQSQSQKQKMLQFYSPKNIKVQNNPQFTKKQQLNSWKSSQSFVIDKSRNSYNMNRISTETNQSKRNSQKINFQALSNQYFGQISTISKNLPQKRSSHTKNENFPRKSFDFTTDTRNRDKSFESQLSLIEDLQTQGKNYSSNHHPFHK